MKTLRDLAHRHLALFALLVFGIAVGIGHARSVLTGALGPEAALVSFLKWVAMCGIPASIVLHLWNAPSRSWGRAGQGAVLVFSGVLALVIVDWLWERSRAGTVLLDAGGNGGWFWLPMALVSAALAVSALVPTRYNARYDRVFRLSIACFFGCVSVFLIAFEGLGGLQIRERGIVDRSGVAAWDDVRSWRWRDDRLVLDLERRSWVSSEEFAVPAAYRATVERLLNAHAPPAP